MVEYRDWNKIVEMLEKDEVEEARIYLNGRLCKICTEHFYCTGCPLNDSGICGRPYGEVVSYVNGHRCSKDDAIQSAIFIRDIVKSVEEKVLEELS